MALKLERAGVEGDWTGSWEGGVYNSNSISYIKIYDADEGSVVQMVGNSDLEGKGATWATFDSEVLNIAEFQFNYTINKGDSFNAGGFMFNIIETDTTLEGYMLSINYNGKFYNLSRTNGAIYKFVYEKGTSVGNAENNRKNVEYLELIQTLNIGKYNSDRGSSGEGTITIEVTDTGYNIKCTELEEDYFIPVDDMQPNTFGFFSDHYDHDCSQIGYFKLDNIKVTVVREK